MGMAFGNLGEERNVKRDKDCEVKLKEVIAYSGEKVVFACTGRIEVYSDGMKVRITESDGTVTTIYNAAVVVKERPKK
ncbi:MAG: hypothetical protein IJ272_05395 [Clostridia bacterium]|nr:hypothetical protein [Clostridia bacterium]